jgi:hypothetical protein
MLMLSLTRNGTAASVFCFLGAFKGLMGRPRERAFYKKQKKLRAASAWRW